MKKFVFMLLILGGLLFSETEFEPVDSTNAEQMQHVKNVLLAETETQFQDMADRIMPLEGAIKEIQKNVSIQQGKLAELDMAVSSNNDTISKLSEKHKNDFIDITNRLTAYSTDFDDFKSNIKIKLDSLSANIQATSKKIETYSSVTQKKIGAIDYRLENRTLYIAIGAFILLCLIIAIFIVLKYFIKNRTRALDESIIDTRNKMETEAIKLDAKLIDLLEKQLQLTELKTTAEEEEKDHSIFIKVANEIQRMRTRIKHMPEDTRGIGALKNALRRLEEELNDNEYELIDLTGKEYDDGLTTDARFVPSNKIETGKEIITTTIKPQVSYRGVLVQMSKIEVSIGE